MVTGGVAWDALNLLHCRYIAASTHTAFPYFYRTLFALLQVVPDKLFLLIS